jgi:hypothetical protein
MWYVSARRIREKVGGISRAHIVALSVKMDGLESSRRSLMTFDSKPNIRDVSNSFCMHNETKHLRRTRTCSAEYKF